MKRVEGIKTKSHYILILMCRGSQHAKITCIYLFNTQYTLRSAKIFSSLSHKFAVTLGVKNRDQAPPDTLHTFLSSIHILRYGSSPGKSVTDSPDKQAMRGIPTGNRFRLF
jgi:hypothetical protein